MAAVGRDGVDGGEAAAPRALSAEFALGTTNAGAAAFILTLSSEKYGLLAKDRVRVNVLRVNLIIDSLNQHGFGTPTDSTAVEAAEDAPDAPGKILLVNSEMTKGQPGFFDQIFVGNHNHAGWRFNSDYDVLETHYDEYGNPYYVYVRMSAAQADGLATTNLIAKPFFDPFKDNTDADIPGWPAAASTLYTNDGANATFPLMPLSAATTTQILWHAKLLAEAVPPLSGPAGSMPSERIINGSGGAFNMMDPPFRDTALWPATRPRKSDDQQDKQRWLHGDYKDAPYLLTHGLYLKIADIVQ